LSERGEIKMLKNVVIVASIVAVFSMAGVTLSISEQTVIDFSGTWIVRWLDNDSRNPMSLTQTDGRLTGTYVNDKKDTCSVVGEYAQNNNRITLRIDCPKWDINMEGLPSLDAKTIEGSYIAYGTSKGAFVMTKKSYVR
jgi:hypothetical protein